MKGLTDQEKEFASNSGCDGDATGLLDSGEGDGQVYILPRSLGCWEDNALQGAKMAGEKRGRQVQSLRVGCGRERSPRFGMYVEVELTGYADALEMGRQGERSQGCFQCVIRASGYHFPC